MASSPNGRLVLLGSSRAPGGTFYGLNGQTIVGDANGAWTITANGTNQNVTLAPSGTGRIAYTYGDQISIYLGKYQWTDATTLVCGVLEINNAGSAGAGENGFLRFRRARGTLSSPVALQAGDYLASMSVDGYDGTAYGDHSDAAIILTAAGAFTSISHPTSVGILNTPSGSTTKRQMAVFTDADLIVGFNAPTTALASGNGLKLSYDGSAVYQADTYGTGANPMLLMRRARGSLASPSATQSGDVLGSILGRGYGATAWGGNNVAAISLKAVSNFTDSSQETQIVIGTTASGSTSRTDWITINGNGNIISTSSTASTSTTTGAIVVTGGIGVGGAGNFGGAIAIGNTVQAAAGVASTHKVTISIGGTIYYLLASNV